MLPGPREVLRERARTTPTRRAFLFLDETGAEAASLTDGALHAHARDLAARLAEHTRAGDRALLAFAPGLAFLVAFFGCLEAGVIAVPVAPPRRGRLPDAARAVVADAGPAVVLADAVTATAAGEARLAGVPWLVVDVVEGLGAVEPHDDVADPAGPAFLQYTSGSTSAPKGLFRIWSAREAVSDRAGGAVSVR